MGHPCEDGLEEEREVTEEVVVIEIDVKGDTRRGEDDVVVEIDAEFKPIDHLLQPPDADRTAKWPMPGSSLLHVGGTLNESYTESLWKKTESLATNEERTAQQSSAQTDRKRHHSIARDPVPSLFSSPQYNIFQVFHQCKELES